MYNFRFGFYIEVIYSANFGQSKVFAFFLFRLSLWEKTLYCETASNQNRIICFNQPVFTCISVMHDGWRLHSKARKTSKSFKETAWKLLLYHYYY